MGAAPVGREQLVALRRDARSLLAPATSFYLRTLADTSLDVNGIASGSPDLVKTVLPVEARANVSIRLAPGQDPARSARRSSGSCARRLPRGRRARDHR